jgi:Co/Zn/Cd efflux system component
VVVSVLVIIGLFAAQQLNWLWLDPVVGMLGATVVALWSWSLVRAAGAVLLDMAPEAAVTRRIVERLEHDGDHITDLHVWRVGPGHLSAIVTLVCHRPELPSVYKSRLATVPHLSHVTIEVERYPGTL